jgi:hypothetical protein
MRDLAATYKFQERSIKTWIAEMENIFGELKNGDETKPDSDFSTKEIAGAKKQRFEYLANRVYNLCISYFEAKDLRIYVSKFDEKIKPFISDKTLLMSSASSFLGEDLSALTQTFWQFLNSFPEFGSIDEKHLTGVDFLENILESTAVVLKELNVSPTSESQVYSSVKILCKATFPDAIFPTESFQKTAKCYKPDILIPILGCAVEYKYATTEEKLVTTIDEILIDVKGYDSHNIYKQFYAVFYVTPGHITGTRFKQIWTEKKFPTNWKGIFVLGN